MADNFYKINKGINLRPQSLVPTNPSDGDIYFDNASQSFLGYKNGAWSTVGGGLETVSVSSNTTAEPGKHYLTDTTLGSFTITLPAGEAGDVIRISDSAETWNINTLNIQPATGESIDGFSVDEPLIGDVKRGWVELSWDDSLGSWSVMTFASTSGSGSGEINTISDPDSSNGWVDSSTGTTSETTTTSSEIPLFPVFNTAIKITVSSSSTDYTRYRFTMPEALKNRVHKIQWEQLIGSTYLAGDFELELYYNSASDYSGGFTQVTLYHDSAIGAIEGQYYNEFLADQTYYELRIVQTTATAAATNWISLNNVIVGPGISASGALVTPWESYTPTLSSTATSGVNFKWRRNGESLEVIGAYTIVTRSTTEIQVSLPNNYVLSLPGTDTIVIGQWTQDATSSNNYAVLGTNGDSFVNCGRLETGGTLSIMDPITDGGVNIARQSVKFSAPISAWAGTGTVNLLTPEVVESNARVRYNLASNQAAGANTVVLFVNKDTTTFENLGDFTNSSGVVTIPVDGSYEIRAQAFVTGDFTTQTFLYISVDRGSGFTDERTLADRNSGRTLNGDDILKLKAGDKVRIRYAGESKNISSNTSVSWLTITRIPDISAKSALGFGLATSSAAGLIGGSGGVAVSPGRVGEALGSLRSGTNGSAYSVRSSTNPTNTDASVISLTLNKGVYLVGFRSACIADASTRQLNSRLTVGGTSVTQTFSQGIIASNWGAIAAGPVPVIIAQDSVTINVFSRAVGFSATTAAHELWAIRIS